MGISVMNSQCILDAEPKGLIWFEVDGERKNGKHESYIWTINYVAKPFTTKLVKMDLGGGRF